MNKNINLQGFKKKELKTLVIDLESIIEQLEEQINMCSYNTAVLETKNTELEIRLNYALLQNQ